MAKLSFADETLAGLLTLSHVLRVQLLRECKNASRGAQTCCGNTAVGRASPLVLDTGRDGRRGLGDLVRRVLCLLLALSCKRLCSVGVGVRLGDPRGSILLCLLDRHPDGRHLVLGFRWDDSLALQTGLELFGQIVVVAGQTTHFNDNLVQEVVNLMFIVATTELSRGEILVKDILGHERHVVTSVDSFGGAAPLYIGCPQEPHSAGHCSQPPDRSVTWQTAQCAQQGVSRRGVARLLSESLQKAHYQGN